MILLLLGLLVGWAITKSKTEKVSDSSTGIILEKQEWELCWSDDETGRSQRGVARNIVFDNTGEVLSLTMYNATTCVTATFIRKNGNKQGIWNQPGKSGTWFLRKIPDNQYLHIGWVKGEIRADLVLTKK